MSALTFILKEGGGLVLAKTCGVGIVRGEIQGVIGGAALFNPNLDASLGAKELREIANLMDEYDATGENTDEHHD